MEEIVTCDWRKPKRRLLKNLPKQKVAVLIDDENLSIEGSTRHKVDFGKLLDLVGARAIVRAILYKSARDYSFPTELQTAIGSHYGIEVRTPPKNIDCWLIIDAVSLAAKVDVVVLVAGDKDYVPLTYYLKTHGCRVEVLSWKDKTADCLIAAADRFVPLDAGILMGEAA